MEYRQINNVFVSTGINVGCAWNCTPIDGTDISYNIVAIGCEFRFSTNINLSVLPQLTQNNAQ